MFLKKSSIISVVFFGLTSMTFGDNVPPSTDPPGGLDPENVPQFVNWGFDDNYGTGGIQFILDYFKDKTNPVGPNNNPLTYDGTPARVVFYITSEYSYNRALFQRMIAEGHEIGNHTVKHENGGNIFVSDEYPIKNYSVSEWEAEMNGCTNFLVNQVGAKEEDIWGFRIPFLSYNENCFKAIKRVGLVYDCSLHGGSEHTGADNYNWPYTMDGSSPGQTDAGYHAGVWQIPTHYCVRPSGQIITGLDFNMIDRIDWGAAGMSKSEFLGTLKKTFDMRYNGNRAPFTFGAHSHYYGLDSDDECPNMTIEDRRSALAEFFDYVLSKPDVRVVPTKAIITWMRNPVGLDQTPIATNVSQKSKKLLLHIKNMKNIEFTIPRYGFFGCRLFSTTGKLIRTLTDTYLAPGSYTLPIPANEISAGTYFIKLEGGKDSKVVRFVLL